MADESLDRLVESLALINVNLEGLRISLVAVTETKADHEQRLRSIERWRYHLSPVLAVLTFILGAVTTAAMDRLFSDDVVLLAPRAQQTCSEIVDDVLTGRLLDRNCELMLKEGSHDS